MFGEITRDDAAGRARANNHNVVPLLGHQCLSLSQHFYRSINTRGRRLAIAAPDPEIDWTLFLESDLAAPAREITSHHRVDRQSLLLLEAPHDAVARTPPAPALMLRAGPRQRRGLFMTKGVNALSR
jgi:hypothetical protein